MPLKDFKKRAAAATKRPADACSTGPKKRLALAEPWYKHVGGPEPPNWAKHFVDTLSVPLGNLKAKMGDAGKLVTWNDCAGKCTEVYASKELSDELMENLGIGIEFKLYGGSDSSRHCRDFVACNYVPKHFSDDIFKRDFDAGTFECTVCEKTCILPRAGVDLYSACFPCGPWSRRGKRLGLADRHADVCWQVIKSIKHMMPVMFIMENVMEISNSSADRLEADLAVIRQFMYDELGASYHHLVVNNSSPIQHGYPAEKKRVLVLGGRSDQVDRPSLQSVFAKLIENPLPVPHTYWTLLAVQAQPGRVLDKVGQLPYPNDALMIQSSGCKCGIDPMIECPQHPCFCDKCKGGERLECTWRAKATKFLGDNGLQWAVADGCVTYIQALELNKGKTPHSARERQLVNMLARLPAAQPLRSTVMIMDISQAVDRCKPKYDGTVPTMATNARMWMMRAGRELNLGEMAKLMGHDLCETDLRFTSKEQMRQMLGMSMHVATAGFAMTGLIAAVGGDS